MRFILREVNSADDTLPAMSQVAMKNRVTLNVPTMFSKEAVNQVTAEIYNEEGEEKWTPRTFITVSSGNSHGGNNYDVDVEHLCVPVMHPITGETITQYR